MLRDLFVYGSLRAGADAHHLVAPDAEAICRGRLESWGLYGATLPYPVVAPRPGAVVIGDVITLSADATVRVLEMLDEYEGPGYDRRLCTVRAFRHGTSPVHLDAWVYVAAPEVDLPEGELIGGGDWLSHRDRGKEA